MDTLDPRAGRKCGKYSNQSNVLDAMCQVKERSYTAELQKVDTDTDDHTVSVYRCFQKAGISMA